MDLSFISHGLEDLIKNPLSLITNPINRATEDFTNQLVKNSKTVVKGIADNITEISGSKDKRGLNALNENIGGLFNNTINNINPIVLVGGVLGVGAVLLLIIKI